jgi:hypothetical protein
MSESAFWALRAQAQSFGITPSRLGQLAKLCQDYERAYQILRSALSKKKGASAYLGKVIANLKEEQAPPFIQIPRSHEPEIVMQARLHGWPVRKSMLSNGQPGWWVAGSLIDRGGDVVGG